MLPKTTGCCDLGYENMVREGRVLHETDNFLVVPTIGQMGIEGYLLVLSKEHKIGVGDVADSQHKELRDVVDHTRSVLQQQYGVPSLVFEHGPRVCGVRGGGCLDHAHLHVVPGVTIAKPLLEELLVGLEEADHFFKVERIEGFKRVADIYAARKTSYLYVDDPSKFSLVTEVNTHIPSQFLRRIIAEQKKIDVWDWAVDPDYKTFHRTFDRLTGKF